MDCRAAEVQWARLLGIDPDALPDLGEELVLKVDRNRWMNVATRDLHMLRPVLGAIRAIFLDPDQAYPPAGSDYRPSVHQFVAEVRRRLGAGADADQLRVLYLFEAMYGF